jgi:hypothetical protein
MPRVKIIDASNINFSLTPVYTNNSIAEIDDAALLENITDQIGVGPVIMIAQNCDGGVLGLQFCQL